MKIRAMHMIKDSSKINTLMSQAFGQVAERHPSNKLYKTSTEVHVKTKSLTGEKRSTSDGETNYDVINVGLISARTTAETVRSYFSYMFLTLLVNEVPSSSSSLSFSSALIRS